MYCNPKIDTNVIPKQPRDAPGANSVQTFTKILPATRRSRDHQRNYHEMLLYRRDNFVISDLLGSEVRFSLIGNVIEQEFKTRK